MEKRVFKILGKVLVTDKARCSFNRMNRLAMRQGLFVPEELCYGWLYVLLDSQSVDPNSTFYQKWNDVTSKTRWQLFLDQVRHYASTYGTDFQGEVWLPERSNLPEFPFQNLRVLEPITMNEVVEEAKKMAYLNIAYSKEVLDFLIELKSNFEINKIQNRELKLMCIDDTYKFKSGQECLLWILWKFFKITMLVKNEETLSRIQPEPEMATVLKTNDKVLASVFYRNKDVFMRFKKEKSLAPIVNRIRRLAPKMHKPMEKSKWLMLPELSKEERSRLFKSASIFKLVQMYNVLHNPTGYYLIRNGKAFYKDSIKREFQEEILEELFKAIVDKVPSVEEVTLPKGIELAMPTSEKNFIGNIPIGSTVDCNKMNTMFGIHWKEGCGAVDLDLHAMTANGTIIGWNASYHQDQNVIFSGDMTTPGTEVIWFKKRPKDSILSVSEFRGDSKYHYTFFIAQEKATDFSKNYMVDPRNIFFKAEMAFENKRDVTLGYIKDGNFVFHSCNVGNGLVPTTFREKILTHLQQCEYLSLRTVLEFKGINIVDDSEVKLLSKGDLINFFSSPQR